MTDCGVYCIFIKWITAKLHVRAWTLCFTVAKSMSLSAGLSLSLLSNRLRGRPRDRLCGLRGWRSALRAAALVDVVLACQQPEFPCPEHIGRVRLQVFMMHWMWFGKSNSDPFTVQSWESASSLPLSWCSYSSWKSLKENGLTARTLHITRNFVFPASSTQPRTADVHTFNAGLTPSAPLLQSFGCALH